VDALEKFCTAKDAEGKSIASDKRAQQYTRDLEEILFLDPTDIEVKAFLVGHLWENQRGQLATVSHVAVDALLEQVFAVSPRHPAHHYRIHLWDQRRPQQALASAALCGPSGPGIAHMWHMPGHIYAGLHRYHDAVWQMEASARVDHRQMTRDQVLPDQIHNYAHNNEWLIRNLLKVGRATEALALAENMLALPRHPAYNIGDKGSGRYGRQRSIATIASYRLWDELLSRADSIFGQTPEKDQLQWEKWQHVGIAAALAGQAETAAEMQVELAKILEQKLAEKEKTAPPAQESTIGDPDQVQKPAESGEPPSQLPAQTSAEEQASAAADRPVETKPVEAETADTKPVEAETADTKPVEAETADTKPVEAETADTKTRATAEQSPTEDAAKVAQAEPGAVAGEPVAAGQQPDEAASETPAANRNSQQRRRRSESPLDNDIETLRKASAGVEAAVAAAARDWETAVTRAEQASGIDGLLKAEWQAMAGQFSQARELSRREVEQRPNDVVPLAVDLYIAHQQWQADSIPGEAAAMDNASDADETVPTEPSDPETARQQLQRDFETLRRLAAQADLETPLLSRLSRLAADCGYPGDWRLPLESQHDLGERPPLESLGPLHWSPYAAPNLMVFDSTGLEVQPWENREQAKLVMFYLGFGCLHCMEQLQKFSPEAERFAGAGIKLMAISCEPLNLLQQGLQNSEQTLKIPLHADPNLVGFKAFRCHDDFENQPLHGTFLIAPDGRVLWQDIGHEPFMDAEFVFLESKRLLELWSAKQSLWTSADAAD